MKILMTLMALFLGLLGLVFIAGHQGESLRIVVGAVLLVAAIAMLVATRMKPQVHQHAIVQKIDIGGQVQLQSLKCRECAASLSNDSLKIVSGAAMVTCPYCGAAYQLEEAPTW